MGGYARSTSKWSKPQLGEVIFIYCNTSKHRVTNAEAFREHGKRCRARAENHGPARDGLGARDTPVPSPATRRTCYRIVDSVPTLPWKWWDKSLF